MRTCGLAEVVSIVMSMETKSIPYQVAGCLRRRRRYLFEPFCLFQRISSLDDVLARRPRFDSAFGDKSSFCWSNPRLVDGG